MLTPILSYPDFNRQFSLDTDASITRIVAVLSQVDNEQVIAYASRVLTEEVRKYCVIYSQRAVSCSDLHSTLWSLLVRTSHLDYVLIMDL